MTARVPQFSRADWALTFAGLILAATLLISAGRGGAAPGSPFHFTITVVPPDAQGLDCAAGAVTATERCAFDDPGQAINVARPLRPFVTTSAELLLLAGVFEEAHVESWLREASARNSSVRVTLDCRGQFLGHSGGVKVRFGSSAAWRPERAVPIGTVDDCRVIP